MKTSLNLNLKVHNLHTSMKIVWLAELGADSQESIRCRIKKRGKTTTTSILEFLIHFSHRKN